MIEDADINVDILAYKMQHGGEVCGENITSTKISSE